MGLGHTCQESGSSRLSSGGHFPKINLFDKTDSMSESNFLPFTNWILFFLCGRFSSEKNPTNIRNFNCFFPKKNLQNQKSFAKKSLKEEKKTEGKTYQTIFGQPFVHTRYVLGKFKRWRLSPARAFSRNKRIFGVKHDGLVKPWGKQHANIFTWFSVAWCLFELHLDSCSE